MLTLILLILILLWLFGFLQLSLLSTPIFTLGSKTVSLNDILVFLVILWLIGILPSPFRQIASVLFVLWILSITGILAIAGFSNIILIAIIFGVIAYLARGHSYE